MSPSDRKIINEFKQLVSGRIKLDKVILFGSRARGGAGRFSDLDTVVVVDGEVSDEVRDFISDCAWEAGFEHGVVVVPIVFTKNEWEKGPERSSLLAQAVKDEGISL